MSARNALKLDARAELEEYSDTLDGSLDAIVERVGWWPYVLEDDEADYNRHGTPEHRIWGAAGGNNGMGDEYDFPHNSAELWDRVLDKAERICETGVFQMVKDYDYSASLLDPLEIPVWFFPRFQLLTFLSFHSIGLEEIPDAIGLCRNLQVLELTRCSRVRRISKRLAECSNLLAFEIHEAALERVPPQLYSGLRKLESISLLGCGRAIPNEFQRRCGPKSFLTSFSQIDLILGRTIIMTLKRCCEK